VREALEQRKSRGRWSSIPDFDRAIVGASKYEMTNDLNTPNAIIMRRNSVNNFLGRQIPDLVGK
jgi:hypothetical protein